MILERHPLLSRLTTEQAGRLSESGSFEEFAPGENVVVEGSLGDALYLVLVGQVEVSKQGMRLATLAPGEFFGEMSLVEPAPRSATVAAVVDSLLFRLPTVSLFNLQREDPMAFSALLIAIVKTLSERMRRANRLVTSVGELADWLAGSLV